VATALDDRTFESAVELTPEQQDANIQHFKDKGYDVEVENAGTDGVDAPATVPDPKPATEEVQLAPAADAPPVTTPDPEIDAETQTEFQTAKNDGEKLSRWAKLKKQKRELESTVSQKDTELAAEKARSEELRRQLAERTTPGTAPVPPASSLAPTVEAPKPAETSPEPIKEFDKAKPTRPTAKDFEGTEDPYAALLEAQGEYAEKLLDWNNEKRTFEDSERARVAKETQERERARTKVLTQAEQITQRYEAARKVHPDYDAVTQPVPYTQVLQYVLREKAADGFELGYELAKPENAEFYKAIMESSRTAVGEADASIWAKVEQTIADLGGFRYALKTKSASPVTAEPVPPAVAAPQPPAPKQTPSTQEPRREEAAPTPVRSRGAAAERLEDIDPEDSDARRAFKKRNGIM